MNIPEISSLIVIGAGQMGSGIALVCASKGYRVHLAEKNLQILEKSQATMTTTADKLLAQGVLSSVERDAVIRNITYTSSLNTLPESQLVIEAASENEEVKKEIFSQLDALQAPSCIFASNTSSLSITRLASYTKRPQRFIGMHFMNPVPKMRLLELIPGLATAPETQATIARLGAALGKEVVISRDYPGFIVNRLLMPMINEAFTVLMEGLASREEIDLAMKLGTNQPMGPLALADFIGLDTCLAILEIMHEDLASPRFKPCPLLRQYVAARWLGRKAGRGVYTYER
jgi:3-hydroxybutyryl-CoA dehydrogenase